ncbi:hypothetical protein [Pseudescherichia sp.]|uniref:hypothetical protein n=1 Tax=Pseudescherichia sp. TaxID=2055881 RepID=UPI00289EE4A3|nr:hypothetical protein [Pseudescherichia sp.]
MPVNLKIHPMSGTPIDPGGVRLLTIGEIHLAVTTYGYSIRYSNVWVHRESYLPFNMQPDDVAMSPNGEMWFREGTYSPEFSLDSLEKRHRFLHEMMHVW